LENESLEIDAQNLPMENAGDWWMDTYRTAEAPTKKTCSIQHKGQKTNIENHNKLLKLSSQAALAPVIFPAKPSID
jgi:hypothetical protein